MVKKTIKIGCCIAFYYLALLDIACAAFAPKKGSIIRDAEIEYVLRDIVSPIFKVAGLNPDEAKIYLVVNPEMNAAATVDSTIFLNTGLLTKVNLAELVGIIAHETAHIALEHISRFYGTSKNSSLISMASTALGIAIGAFGNADLGIGTVVLGNQIALRSLLHYSRGQEASADQAAIRYLCRLKWPIRGLQQFLLKLSRRELFSSSVHNVYMITHPLSSTRVQLLDKYVKQYKVGDSVLPINLQKRYRRAMSKLKAFINPPQHMLFAVDKYNIHQEDMHYVKAIAFYRINNLNDSISELQKLQVLEPNNPYLHDLEGQIYYENGLIAKSLQAYKRALHLLPDSNLIRLYYVQSMMQMESYNSKVAINELHKVLISERKNPHVWHLLAVLYGKSGEMDRASLCLAEKFLSLNKFDFAMKQAIKADKITTSKKIKKQAQDIIHFAQKELLLLKGYK